MANPFEVDDFCHSLARFLVAQAAGFSSPVTIPYFPAGANGVDKSGLWIGNAQEGFAADPYSILTPYGGGVDAVRPSHPLAVQCLTRGTVDAATRYRAAALFEGLLNADRVPLKAVTIDGYKRSDDSADGHWRIVWVQPLSQPQSIGRDTRARLEVSFNFDVMAVKQS